MYFESAPVCHSVKSFKVLLSETQYVQIFSNYITVIHQLANIRSKCSISLCLQVKPAGETSPTKFPTIVDRLFIIQGFQLPISYIFCCVFHSWGWLFWLNIKKIAVF